MFCVNLESKSPVIEDFGIFIAKIPVQALEQKQTHSTEVIAHKYEV